MFSGADLMDAAAVLGIQVSTRGIRAHVSASIAITGVELRGENDIRGIFFGAGTTDSIEKPTVRKCSSFTLLLTGIAFEVEREKFIPEQKKNKMLGRDYSYLTMDWILWSFLSIKTFL